jgi:hypothetical protein
MFGFGLVISLPWPSSVDFPYFVYDVQVLNGELADRTGE